MSKQTILVTGGAGYIGSFTVIELLNNGYDVVVLDSLETGHKAAVDKRATLEVANLSDQKNTERILNKYKPLAVIDFAAFLAVGESMEEPKKYFENNVVNFVKLLDALKKSDCKFIIKSSTSSTYGNPLSKTDFPLKENYTENFKPDQSALLPGQWEKSAVSGDIFFQKIIEYYQQVFSDRSDLHLTSDELIKLRIPTSIYGLTKLIDEVILDKYNQSSGFKSISLRYFNACGAALDGKMGEDKPAPTTLMTVAIYSILKKTDPLKVFGNDYPTADGTGIRDYIHPLDLATGHAKALKYLLEKEQSDTFNLGCGKGYSVLEVIKAIEKASGKKVSYEVVPRRSGDPAVSFADATRSKELLGWQSRYNLSDMANSAWKWHSENPHGFSDSKIDSELSE